MAGMVSRSWELSRFDTKFSVLTQSTQFGFFVCR
jgi:hypothetical protein